MPREMTPDEYEERRVQALNLHARGRFWPEIREVCGYPSNDAVRMDVTRALRRRAIERTADADTIITSELEKLATMERVCWAILEIKHMTVSNGRLVTRDGEPIEDDAPVLHALDRLLRIQERRARLIGLDAPIKSRVEVRNVDALDDEFERLLAQLAGRDEAGVDPPGAARGRPEAVPDPA